MANVSNQLNMNEVLVKAKCRPWQ